MASEAYRIPFAPLDFSGIADAIRGGREHRRSMEYLAMERQAVKDRAERESKALARQEANDKYNREVAAFNARPAIERAAMRSFRATGTPGSANMNPYGITFDVQQDAPPSIKDVDIMGARGGEYGDYARARLGQTPTMKPIEEAQDEVPQPETVYRGADTRAPIGQHSGNTGGPITNEEEMANISPSPGPALETTIPNMAPSGIEQAQAILGAPRKSKLFGSVNGQRYEVADTSETSGFGPEYDDLYNRMIADGDDPHKARSIIAQMVRADNAEQGRKTRADQQIEFRNLNREDQQAFTAIMNKLYRNEPTTAAEREKLARIRASAMMAGQGNKDEASVDRAMSLIGQKAKAFREVTQYSKMVQSDKTIRELFNNIASGSVNLQNRDAQIQLAKYFRGSIPTGAEMTHLYTNLGGTADAWNRFKSNMLKGRMTPEEIRQLRASASAVRKEHEENKVRMVKVGRRFFGPGSGLDNYPDQAQAQFDAHLLEMGIDPDEVPPLYQTTGGAAMGGFARPRVQPRQEAGSLDEMESRIDAAGAR